MQKKLHPKELLTLFQSSAMLCDASSFFSMEIDENFQDGKTFLLILCSFFLLIYFQIRSQKQQKKDVLSHFFKLTLNAYWHSFEVSIAWRQRSLKAGLVEQSLKQGCALRCGKL